MKKIVTLALALIITLSTFVSVPTVMADNN